MITALRRVMFWPGHSGDIDFQRLSGPSVKGYNAKNRLRFLEIYAEVFEHGINKAAAPFSAALSPTSPSSLRMKLSYIMNIPDDALLMAFWPPGFAGDISVLAKADMPPFKWCSASPQNLGVAFVYNANALGRIFNGLVKKGKISPNEVDLLFDLACLLLCRIYMAKNYFVLRNMNNNFNMYLIPKVVEFIVGAKVFNAERQELDITLTALRNALEIAREFESFSPLELMALAVGEGVVFIEQRLQERQETHLAGSEALKTCDIAVERSQNLKIDHRHLLVDMAAGLNRTGQPSSDRLDAREVAEKSARNLRIDRRFELVGAIEASNYNGIPFNLAVILDDAVETVFDLMWLAKLLDQYPLLRVNFLVNTVQTSINFSQHMLATVLQHPLFANLAKHQGTRFIPIELYSPLISFQFSLLPRHALDAIAAANAVFVKGMNFFETCQIPNKPSFHAFVVYGPISEQLTGLENGDGVFAHLPVGETGYVHDPDGQKVLTLSEIVRRNEVLGLY